jgi:hypothetical protein
MARRSNEMDEVVVFMFIVVTAAALIAAFASEDPPCIEDIEYQCYEYTTGFLGRSSNEQVSCQKEFDFYRVSGSCDRDVSWVDKEFGDIPKQKGDKQ